jgi:hypothetical protein
MNIGVWLKFITSILFIVMGLTARYSYNDGWSAVKKYWVYIVVLGVISLVINICKYWL